MEPERTYRTHLSLRVAVVAAAVLWGAAAAALARVPGAGATSLCAAAMSAFFVAAAIGYQRTVIQVTPEVLVARSPLRRRVVHFEDVLEVIVRDGPAGRAYAVLTRRGTFRFTCLLARHRELLETVLERAGLDPVPMRAG